MPKKYTLQQLQSALEQVSANTDAVSALCASLIIEKINFLKKAGRKRSEKSLRERQAEYQRKWRAKRKEKAQV